MLIDRFRFQLKFQRVKSSHPSSQQPQKVVIWDAAAAVDAVWIPIINAPRWGPPKKQKKINTHTRLPCMQNPAVETPNDTHGGALMCPSHNRHHQRRSAAARQLCNDYAFTKIAQNYKLQMTSRAPLGRTCPLFRRGHPPDGNGLSAACNDNKYRHKMWIINQFAISVKANWTDGI